MDDYIVQYLTQFEIDRADLGRLAGQGTQHYIYHYQPGKVLKIPKRTLFSRVFGPLKAEDVQRDADILKTYMSDYIAKTEVICADNGCYVVVQEVLTDYKPLTYARLGRVREHFARIVEANNRIATDHCLALDLLGNKGYWRCVMASLMKKPFWAASNNLFVTKENGEYTIKIVDLNLSNAYMGCGKPSLTAAVNS